MSKRKYKLDREDVKIIPVNLDRPLEHEAKIVYAIPAKPKPKQAWWKENFGICWL